jgi:UDP-3-O-[3-hydroxymyristoyl] glucosamine N-acyltransferase
VSVTVRELAELVQGTVAGDGNLPIQAARVFAEAKAGDITFLDQDHKKDLAACQATAIVVPMQFPVNGRTLIQVADPLAAFIAIVKQLHGRPERPRHGIDPHASVHPTAKLGPDASVHAFAAIGEGTTIGARCRIHEGAVIGRFCKLGDDVTIYPNAVLYDGTVAGHRVMIHANVVIGADGFGYRFQAGKHVKIPQQGYVELADDVEIGACATIDRATFGVTRVGPGTKIDNLVQVGHNCQIGPHNLLCSQVGVAGSCSTGSYVVAAGQVGIADHVNIGDGVVLGAKAGVPSDIPAGQRVLGAPARPERDAKRILLSLDRLPKMVRDLEKVKQRLGIDDESIGKMAG